MACQPVEGSACFFQPGLPRELLFFMKQVKRTLAVGCQSSGRAPGEGDVSSRPGSDGLTDNRGALPPGSVEIPRQ